MSDYGIVSVSFEHWLCMCNERKRNEPNRTDPKISVLQRFEKKFKKTSKLCPFHSGFSSKNLSTANTSISTSTLKTYQVTIERKRKTYCREAILRIRDENLPFPLNCASRRQLRGIDMSKKVEVVKRKRNFVPLKKRETEEKFRLFTPIDKKEVVSRKINRKYASLCALYKPTDVTTKTKKRNKFFRFTHKPSFLYASGKKKRKMLDEANERYERAKTRFTYDNNSWKRIVKKEISDWCYKKGYPCTFGESLFRMRFRRLQLKTLKARRKTDPSGFFGRMYHNFRRKTRSDDHTVVRKDRVSKKSKGKQKVSVSQTADSTTDPDTASLLDKLTVTADDGPYHAVEENSWLTIVNYHRAQNAIIFKEEIPKPTTLSKNERKLLRRHGPTTNDFFSSMTAEQMAEDRHASWRALERLEKEEKERERKEGKEIPEDFSLQSLIAVDDSQLEQPGDLTSHATTTEFLLPLPEPQILFSRPYTLDKTLYLIGGGTAFQYNEKALQRMTYDVLTDSFVSSHPMISSSVETSVKKPVDKGKKKKKSWLSYF